MLNIFGKKKDNLELYSPVKGKAIALEQVADKMFAQKVLGDGIAVLPNDGTICAPCDGVISTIAQTKHAFGITASNGAEILVHVGFDTVNLQGEGFQVCAKQGQKVKAHQPVLNVDLKFMEEKQINMTTPVVIANIDDYEITKIIEVGNVTQETQMASVHKK